MSAAERCEGGHAWKRADDGSVDDWAMDDEVEHHNGPMCTACFESFCRWCEPARWERLMAEENAAKEGGR